MGMKVVIIGGVAGGASCAARLRRLNESAEIVLFEQGDAVSFANCGLPYHIGGVIEKRDALLVQTANGLMRRYHMSVYIKTRVVDINRVTKTLTVLNLADGKMHEESYDKLVLSPGATPFTPPIKGIDAAHIIHLRNLADMDKIIAALKNKTVKHAVVVGAGFVGVEVAENLKHLGIAVSIVEKAPQLLTNFDPEMANELAGTLSAHGVALYFNDGLKALENDGTRLILESGKTLDADLIILALGVRPNTELAIKAGLTLGQLGGISVNAQFQTSDPDIYAIGDAIEDTHLVTGEKALMALAGPANRAGRMVADHIAGLEVAHHGSLGSTIIKVCDMVGGSTGLNQSYLSSHNLPFESIHLFPASHATYYPGASPLSFKLLFNPLSGSIYGAQAIGKSNVDKLIDTIATAITAGMSVYDLSRLDLCYAPPFGTAKSPVNYAGYIAANIRNGLKMAQYDQASQLAEEGATIINVCTKKEHEAGHLPKAINITLDDLRSKLDEIPKSNTLYVHCAVGMRGYMASRILSQNGFDVVNFAGGYKRYHLATTPYDQLQSKATPTCCTPVAEQSETKVNEPVTPIVEPHKKLNFVIYSKNKELIRTTLMAATHAAENGKEVKLCFAGRGIYFALDDQTSLKQKARQVVNFIGSRIGWHRLPSIKQLILTAINQGVAVWVCPKSLALIKLNKSHLIANIEFPEKEELLNLHNDKSTFFI